MLGIGHGVLLVGCGAGKDMPPSYVFKGTLRGRSSLHASHSVAMNRGRQFGYGTADLGIAAVESVVQLYLLKFYSEVVGLAATWVGVALAIAMVWDAISDPLMGGISDRTSYRDGRRRPYFVPGSILLALTFFFLFNPPV